jgi:hypothetical protein
MKSRMHSDVFERVVLSLCEKIDTPRSLATWLCFKHSPEELLNLPPVDVANNDTDEYQLDYFVTEYLSKYKGLKTSIDTREVALGKWRSAEQKCRETNQKFREYKQRPFSGRAETVLFRTQRKIAHLLGPLDVSRTLSDCKWGPGATFDFDRRHATPDNKISQAISVTESAFPYFRAVLQSDPHWSSVFLDILPEAPFSLVPSSKWFKFVRGSRFLTVPKSAKTDRAIAAEPTANSFLQQGVHSYLSTRLKRVGIDLSKQDTNQLGAQDAYLEGLATLDLSAASDTISRELVYHLLPIDWALYLDSLRSPETLVDGEWIRTEKFASMGNAFCFDLETIIFWAIARSVVDEGLKLRPGSVDRVHVYGDDIIVPQWAAEEVVEMLQFCGFTVNPDKSHIGGNFFESCGKHFHRARDVTPVYQKEVVKHPSEIIRAHNRLIRLASCLPSGMLLIRKAAQELANSYPLRPFPKIPYGALGDDGFLRPLSEFTLDKNHGYLCRVLVFVPRLHPAREDAMYAYKLRRFPKHQRGRRFDDYLGDHSSNEPSNPDPRGYVGNVAEGKWRTRVRWVSEMSLTELVSDA